MLLQLFFALASTVAFSSAERVTLCGEDALQCVRYTLATLLNYQPVVGDGADSVYVTTPFSVIAPAINTTCLNYEAEFSGFSSGKIVELFQEDGFTVLTVNFARVTTDNFLYTCTFFTHGYAPTVLQTYGQFQFDDVTATIIFAGTEQLDIVHSRVVVFLNGAYKLGIDDITVQAQLPGNELVAAALAAAQTKLPILAREVFNSPGVANAVASAYTATNLVFNPNAAS